MELITFGEIRTEIGMAFGTITRRTEVLGMKVYKKSPPGAGRPCNAIRKKDLGDLIGYQNYSKNQEWMNYGQVSELLGYTRKEVMSLARKAGVKGVRKWSNGDPNGKIHFSPKQVEIIEKYDLLKKINPDDKARGVMAESSAKNTKNRERGLYHRLTEYGGLYGLENNDSLSVVGL